MDDLLKSETIEVLQKQNTEQNVQIDQASVRCDGENIYLAVYDSRGTLHLATIGKKYSGGPVVKRLNWNLDEKLRSLSFNYQGSSIAAVTDDNIAVLDFSGLLSLNRSVNDGIQYISNIKLPKSYSHVSCSVWWKTSVNKDILIVATSKGDILLIDIQLKKLAHKTLVNGYITSLQIVPDDRQSVTYVLISARSGLQWKLLLDILDLDLHKHKTESEMFSLGYHFYGGHAYVKSILYQRQDAGDREFAPQRFTNIPIAATLNYQYAKGCHLMSAIDARDNSFKIYDSSVQHHPLYEYFLPEWSEWVVYTDKLIYCAVEGKGVSVLSNHLSESNRNIGQNTSAGNIFHEHLGSDEKLMRMAPILLSSSWYNDLVAARSQYICQAKSHTLLDGCILITTKRVFIIKPNISPEQLFLNWSTSDVANSEKLEMLARVTHIDLMQLYIQTATYHVSSGNQTAALDCLSLSNCDDSTAIEILFKFNQWAEVIKWWKKWNSRESHIKSRPNSTVASSISNQLLHSYINLINISAGEQLEELEEFLVENQYYSLDLATELLTSAGLARLLIQVSLVRKFVHSAVEYLHKNCRINGDLIAQFLHWKEFVCCIESYANGELTLLLESENLCTYILNSHQLRLPLLMKVEGSLSCLKTETISKLAVHCHPKSQHVVQALWRQKESSNDLGAFNSDYAFPEQEAEDIYRTSYPEYCRIVYLFFVKLVIELSSRGSHKCLYLDDVVRALPVYKQSMVLEIQRRPLACSSTNVFVVCAEDIYSWGSKIKLDTVKIDDRVKLSTPSSLVFQKLQSVHVYVMSAGEKHVMALTSDGLYGWGDSSYGQTGTGVYGYVAHPTKVQLDCVDVVCGRYHTLALNKLGRVFSWGWGLFGQLGLNTIESESHPRPITSLKEETIVMVAAGHSHSIALTKDGHVYVFGSNHYGQLGLENPDKILIPKLLTMNLPVTLISTRYFHTLAVMQSGEVYIWGIHPFLLRKKVQRKYSLPVTHLPALSLAAEVGGRRRLFAPDRIDGIIKQIACGAYHALILSSSGAVYVWEDADCASSSPNEGQLLAEEETLTCLREKLPSTVHVACDNGFSVAMTSSGSVYTWGKNENGQLGLSLRSIKYVTEPVAVKFPESYRYIPAPTVNGHSMEQTDNVTTTPWVVDYDIIDEITESDCEPLQLAALWNCTLFPLSDVLTLCIERDVYSACIVLYCMSKSWSEACFYHLKAISSCHDHTENYSEEVLKIVKFYLRRLLDDDGSHISSTKLYLLVLRIFQFWSAKSLCVSPTLEKLLADFEELLSPSISNLILNPMNPQTLPEPFVSQFTTPFLCKITRSVLSKQTLHRKENGLSDSKELSSVNSKRSLSFILKSSELTSLNNNSNSSYLDFVTFSCGHSYTQKDFELTALTELENKIISKLPITGSLLVKKYRSYDLRTLACPCCVLSSIHCMLDNS